MTRPSRVLSSPSALAGSLALIIAGSVLAGEGDPRPQASDACRQVDLGLAYLGSDAVRYGRFVGSGEGFHAVADLLLCREAEPGGDGGMLWRVRGSDLGLRSSQFEAEIRQPGRYRIWLDAQRLPGPGSTGQTPLQGVGSPSLTLPAGWQAAATSAGMSRLLPSLGEVGLGQDRRRLGLGGALWLDQRWKLDASVREERKQGLRSFAGMMGITGGNARSTLLPEPIDHRTRLLNLAASRDGGRLQLRGAFHLSQFDNAVDAVVWQSPFAGVAGWAPSAGYPTGFGRYQPAPDNRFHQISLGAGYALSATTRLTADLAVGRMQQNQELLPYTIDPVLDATVAEPLPRSRFDGRIDTRRLALRLVSRPGSAWRWGLDYRFDERDNRSPRDAWVGIGGDAQAQDASEASSRRRFNLPIGYREQALSANAGYRFGRRNDLSAVLERREVDRSWSSRSDHDETRLRIDLRTRAANRFQAGLRLEASERGGATYLGNRPFLDSYSEAYTDTVAGGFENLPGLRQFHLADRERLRWGLSAGWTPAERWQFGLSAGQTRDDYDASEFGLTRARLRDLQLDGVFLPAAGWSLQAWLGREWMDFDQAGRAFQGGANRLPQANDPNRNWFAEHRDRVDSGGVGLRRGLRDGLATLRADLSRSLASGSIDVRVGPALSAAPLPEHEARLTRLDLSADLRLGPRSQLRLGYRLEDFRSADWSSDGYGPATLANVILLGEQSPDYRAHAVLVSLRYRFD